MCAIILMAVFCKATLDNFPNISSKYLSNDFDTFVSYLSQSLECSRSIRAVFQIR
jgi:hypothetical protein